MVGKELQKVHSEGVIVVGRFSQAPRFLCEHGNTGTPVTDPKYCFSLKVGSQLPLKGCLGLISIVMQLTSSLDPCLQRPFSERFSFQNRVSRGKCENIRIPFVFISHFLGFDLPLGLLSSELNMLDLFVALFGMLFCRILICLVRKNQLCIILSSFLRVIDATQVTFDFLSHISNLITFFVFVFTLVI